jgi:hypothetical protein
MGWELIIYLVAQASIAILGVIVASFILDNGEVRHEEKPKIKAGLHNDGP